MANDTQQGAPDHVPHAPEVESFNLGELDVEELEKRLELAVAGIDGDCWMMSCDTFKPPPP